MTKEQLELLRTDPADLEPDEHDREIDAAFADISPALRKKWLKEIREELRQSR